MAQGLQRGLAARLHVERRQQGAHLVGQLDIEHGVQERRVFGIAGIARGESGNQLGTAGDVRIGRKTQQALQQHAQRIAPGARAEVEDGGGMADQALFTRHMQKLRNQARLAQPGVTAHKNHAPALPLQTGLRQRDELLHFLRAAHQWTAATGGHRALAQDAVGHQRPLLALDLHRLAGLGLEVVRHLLPGLRAYHHFARPGQAAQARSGVDGVTGQGVVTRARVAATRYHQAALYAGVHGKDAPEAR